MKERREHVEFEASTGTPVHIQPVRFRYGEALDAATTDWSTHEDAITLTSEDGSDLDFNQTAFAGPLSYAGVTYDHPGQSLYVVGNTTGPWVSSSDPGGQVYKITGLSTNTWNVQRLTTGGRRYPASNGTFGRLQVARFGSVVVLARVSSTTTPVQIIRLE